MPKGGRPKPDALKVLQGDPGRTLKKKLRRVPDDPAPLGDNVPPPLDLGPVEQRLWNQLLPLLRDRKFLQATDLLTFTRYCKFFALFIEMAPKVRAKELVKVTKSSHVEMERLDKRFAALMQIDKRLCEHEAMFGLNPVARQTFLARQAAQAPRLPFENRDAAKSPAGEVDKQPAAPPSVETRLPSPIGMGRLN